MKTLLKRLFFQAFAFKSIKKQILVSYMFIIILLMVPPICVLALSIHQTLQYDKIITNVNKANILAQIVKTDISDEIWEIVAGKKEFSEGNQYKILHQIRVGITEIQQQSSMRKNLQILEVATRAQNTLLKYVNILGDQIKAEASVSENETILEEIRSVAALCYDIFQDFIVAEIESAAVTNENIKKSVQIFTVASCILFLVVLTFVLFAQWTVSENIRLPIQKLEHFSTQISEGKLSARAEQSSLHELDNLTVNLNSMAEKIQELIDANILEQKNLKKAEMKALQAQITPHFLYNTFDTIIWLAEAGKTKEVVEITKAFSSFFRISLSKGHEWITVAQEIEHIKSYLTVQKIRYRDILDYDITYDPAMANKPMLKLVLQPLVENALYHGIKNRRGRGKLLVSGYILNERMHFSVEDNGIGMNEEHLAHVCAEMNDSMENKEKREVYGLYNVNKRLKLYYSAEAFLNITSEYKKGTTVSFSVPLTHTEGGNNV